MNVEPKRPSVEAKRAKADEPGFELTLRDPSPFKDPATFWRVMAQVSTIAMFVMVFGALLYFARPVILPVLSAIVVGMTAGPVAGWLERRGMASWVSAFLTLAGILAIAYLAIVFLSKPASEMIGRSGEIAAAIKDKFYVLERPIQALRELHTSVVGSGGLTVDTPTTTIIASVLTVVTPALLQIVVFGGTLFFFMLARNDFRQFVVRFFGTRKGRLRALKILNDIEQNLSRYLITVTCINTVVGLAAVLVTWLVGLPNPLLLGALAFALNYLPYIGPGIMHIILFVLGLLTFPTLWLALLPPAIFLAFTIIEGQFIVPKIIGVRFELPPLLVFLNIAFWAWLWGPIGAFLSMPILLAGTVVLNHLYPNPKTVLPE